MELIKFNYLVYNWIIRTDRNYNTNDAYKQFFDMVSMHV